MNFDLKRSYLIFTIIFLAISNLVFAAPSITPIYTDLNVTNPALTINTVLILVGGVYDNGQINQAATLYPGLSTRTSIQTFGKNTILVGCGPCNTNYSDIAIAAGTFAKDIIANSTGLSASYNGIMITNALGSPLAYIVIGNQATTAERQAALSIQVAIAQVQNPPTTTTSIATTSVQTTSVATTSVATTLSTSIATTLSTTIQATTTVPQSAQQTDPISALINAILSFLKSL